MPSAIGVGSPPARSGLWRWLLVVAGVVVLAVSPAATGAVLDLGHRLGPENGPEDPREWLERVRASGRIPHEGVAESRGALGLPDLPRLGGVTGLLSGTTRSRVWWRSRGAWRVDTLGLTGEQGTYGVDRDVVTWDYERRSLTTVLGSPRVRLPRTDDLLPPQAARWLLGDLDPADRLSRLPARRVAGRHGYGVRIQPADARATIGRVDLWVEISGLPLELHVTDRSGALVLVTRFLDVRFEEPRDDVLVPPNPPGARVREVDAREIAAPGEVARLWELPSTLAGLASSGELGRGSATYGRGMVRLVVIPLSGHLAGHLIEDARDSGAEPVVVPGGEAVLISRSLASVIVARGPGREHAYLIAGLVSADLLREAVTSLVRDPPIRRAS